jgi:hypothetical protein
MYSYLFEIDQIIINIIKYLDLRELFRICNVNKRFYNIIMCKEIDSHSKEKYDTEIYDYIDLIYSDPDELPENSDFILSIIKNNKHLKKISLILCENLVLARKIIKKVISKEVNKLHIPLAMLKSSNDLEKFNESLTELTIKNMYFNEVGIEYNILMVENLLKLKNLKKLKLNNIKFIGAEFINLIQSNLEYLDIRECMEFKIQDFAKYLIQDKSYLKTLKLDGENSNNMQLLNIIPNLDNLKELNISYCENLEDSFLDMISVISNKFTKLILRKLRKITQECFIKFFSFSNFENLEKLDFYDAPKLNDKAIVNISLIKKLKYLDISWCEGVSNETVKKIIINCNFISKIYLQGCKNLDDNLFNDVFFYENNDELKQHLKRIYFIDLTKCDYVSDEVINNIYDKYPNLTIINYYGRDLRDENY